MHDSVMNDARGLRSRRCQVVLLDDRRLDFLVQPRLVTNDLLDMVASHFNLHEKEYFGLSYMDETGHINWLRMDKKVLEHELPRYSDPVIIYFSVRFFVPNITLLREAKTVDLFYLQARALIFKGSIQCDSGTIFELAAYVLQATYNNCASDSTARSDLKKLPVLPTRTLKEHPSINFCEDKVIGYYKRLRGLSRGDAILRYMTIFQSLPTYGVHYYEVKDKGGIPWWLGLSPKGVGQYDHNDKVKPRKVYQWNQIENLYFRDRKFSIEIRDSYKFEFIQPRSRSNSLGRRGHGPSSMMVHAWYCATSALAKAMWTMAISQHQFYLDKKQNENRLAVRSFKEMARDLSQSSTSLNSCYTVSDVSDTSSLGIGSSINGGESVGSVSIQNVEREMITALQARKEALQDKLKQKTEELRTTCLQEMELTGELPPETPYIPGKTIPPVRRRIGTAFTFSESVVAEHDGVDGPDEVSKLETDFEIQTKITAAAQRLANDPKIPKSVKKSRKLTYQKSLTKLKTMEQQLGSLRKQVSSSNQKSEPEADSLGPIDEDSSSPQPSPNVSPVVSQVTEKLSSHRYRTMVNVNLSRSPSDKFDTPSGVFGTPRCRESFRWSEQSTTPTRIGPPSPTYTGIPNRSRTPTQVMFHKTRHHSEPSHGYVDAPSDNESSRSASPISSTSDFGPILRHLEEAPRFVQRSHSDRSSPVFAHNSSSLTFDNGYRRGLLSSKSTGQIDKARSHNYERTPVVVRQMEHSPRGGHYDFETSSDSRSSPNLAVPLSPTSFSSDEYETTLSSPFRHKSNTFSNHHSRTYSPMSSSSASSPRYINPAILGLVTHSGSAGSYLVGNKAALSAGSMGHIASKSSLSLSSHTSTSSNLTRSTPYLGSPNPFDIPADVTEDMLEWRSDDEVTEATLV